MLTEIAEHETAVSSCLKPNNRRKSKKASKCLSCKVLRHTFSSTKIYVTKSYPKSVVSKK